MAVVLALVSWLPIAVWALVEGRAFGGRVAEPLFQHFGIHVRCLVAIPFFVIAEATSYGVAAQFIRRLVEGGFVSEADMPRLQAILARAVALRDSWLPWVAIGGLVLGWVIAGPRAEVTHELLWARNDGAAGHSLGFGGWWFLYVARPIFVALLLGWIWRLILWCIVLARVTRLDLSLVPTHADRVMGLGYLERTPSAFQPVFFGMSAVLASVWAHDVVYHGPDVRSLAAPAAGFAIVAAALMLAPLLACIPPLTRAKRQGVARYSALVAEHGRLVRERWILGQDPADGRLLEAPEIGPVADTVSLFEAVKRTRTVPISRTTLILILLPLAAPMVALVALQVPIKQILGVLVKALL